jgi:hypothetical protein
MKSGKPPIASKHRLQTVEAIGLMFPAPPSERMRRPPSGGEEWVEARDAGRSDGEPCPRPARCHGPNPDVCLALSSTPTALTGSPKVRFVSPFSKSFESARDRRGASIRVLSPNPLHAKLNGPAIPGPSNRRHIGHVPGLNGGHREVDVRPSLPLRSLWRNMRRGSERRHACPRAVAPRPSAPF